MSATAKPYPQERQDRLMRMLERTGIPLIYAPGVIPDPRRPRTVPLPELQRDDTEEST